MKRQGVIITILVLLILSVFLEIKVIHSMERKIELLEREYTEALRELTSLQSTERTLNVYYPAEIKFFNMENMGEEEKKYFLEDFFDQLLESKNFEGKVMVEKGECPEEFSDILKNVKCFTITFEINSYSNIGTLVDFLRKLEKFPLLFQYIDMGYAGERKKAFIEIKYVFLELEGD